MVTFAEQDDALDTVLADTGHQLTFNAVTVPCELRRYQEEVFEYEGSAAQLIERIVATIRTTVLPAAAGGGAVTVDTVSYTLLDRRRRGDGLDDLFLKEI